MQVQRFKWVRLVRVFRALGLSCTLVQLGLYTPAVAQAIPSTQEMIEQLRPQPPTRGLLNPRARAIAPESGDRNLIVEPTSKPQPGADSLSSPTAQGHIAAPPSLSLLIQFELDSAQVRPESQALLKNLARALQTSELARSRFAVEGHTDARGRREYNQQLSRRRAESVRDVLAQYGIDPARLIAIGKGSGEPANAADQFSAENRRVRIVNLD